MIATKPMTNFTMSLLSASVLFGFYGRSSAELPRGKFVDAKTVAGIEMDKNMDVEIYPVISTSGLELFFRSDVGDDPEIWVATRTNRNDPFESVSILSEINSPSDDNASGISSDGLTLYFNSDRSGNFDMYQATRVDLISPFGNVTGLGPGVNTNEDEGFPFVSLDGLSLYYKLDTRGLAESRIWTATRQDSTDMFSDATDLGDIVNGNPTFDSWKPSVSADGLTLFFSDGFFGDPRPEGNGDQDIWVSHRVSTEDEFGTPVNLNDMWPGTSVNTPTFEGMAYISPDWPTAGSKLYYNTVNGQAGDIWEATWVPEPSMIGDFNGNGVLDVGDIDELTVRSATGTGAEVHDLNHDIMIDVQDITVWAKDLFGSWMGDLNLDGEFNSSDLSQLLAEGTYAADIDSVWSTGDFNGDGRTDSSDLVVALADGGYELGPRLATAAVPEPASVVLLCIGLPAITRRWR